MCQPARRRRPSTIGRWLTSFRFPSCSATQNGSVRAVLGAHGRPVPPAESEQIVDALREAGIEHEYLPFPDEGHGFAKPENRLRFYEAADRFLARHLGGGAS
ncbi:MAG: prolyl oligopeptidase family serine peptidase [Streptosporangiaceae bacterium]